MKSAFEHAAALLDPPEPVMSHDVWCRTELPQMFPLAFGPHHRWLFERVGGGPQGVRAFEGAPRGSGKSTAAVIGLPASAIAQQTHRFVVIIRATQTEAESALGILRSELERNPELRRRWPMLEFAMKRGGKREKDHEREVRLVGGTIVAIGAGASMRGIIRRGDDGRIMRPDLIVFDDIETRDQARSKRRTDDLEEWLFADVLGLGTIRFLGKTQQSALDVIGIGTTLDTDALATRALRNKGRFRTWQTRRFPAEYQARGHRRAMWSQGLSLEVLDRLLDPDAEEFLGTFTYAKEYLLDPRQRSDAVIRDAWMNYGRAPTELEWVAIGIDPAATEDAWKDEDYSALVEAGLDPDHSRVWVRRVWRDRVSMRSLIEQAEKWQQRSQGRIAFEAVGAFKWVVGEMRRRWLRVRGVKPKGDKVSRIAALGMMIEGKQVWFDESLQDTEYDDELLRFPGGDHDDWCDATYWAVMMVSNEGRRLVRKADEQQPPPTKSNGARKGGPRTVRELAAATRNGRNGA